MVQSAASHFDASILDDLAPCELWEHLTPEQQSTILREFFLQQWDELATLLDDDQQPSTRPRGNRSEVLGHTVRRLWRDFRDKQIERLAADGQIAGEPTGGF
jgi:hypothetical protein